MKKSLDEIYCEIKENQSAIIFQEEKFDRLGRRINRSKAGLVPIERFITKIFINEISKCWEWTGATSKAGYGQFRIHNSVNVKSSPHRFIYEYVFGEIPVGKEIDHKCNNRFCCNPEHLQILSHAENLKKTRKEKCKYGHLMRSENVYTSPAGKRYCKKCRSRAVNESMKKRLKTDSEFRKKRNKYMRDRNVQNKAENLS